VGVEHDDEIDDDNAAADDDDADDDGDDDEEIEAWNPLSANACTLFSLLR
jgi:hypothetical protein